MGLFDFLKGKSKTENEHSKSEGGETITDKDGNVYTTVKIGNQVWTVENLKTTKYNDGTPIPLITNGAEWHERSKPAYCWYENDNRNKDKYGALYNWHAVKTGKLAPKGWHVPTDVEWTELQKYLIANGYNWDGTKEGNKIAKSVAAKTNWKTDSDAGTIGNDLSKNNLSGFTALPGGSRKRTEGIFSDIGSDGNWWSAKEIDEFGAYDGCLSYNDIRFITGGANKGCGFSVRLLRN